MKKGCINFLCLTNINSRAAITVSSLVSCTRAHGQCSAVVTMHDGQGRIPDILDGTPIYRIGHRKCNGRVIKTDASAWRRALWRAQDSFPVGLSASPLGLGCSLRCAHRLSPARLPHALPRRQPLLWLVTLRKSMCSLHRSTHFAPPCDGVNRDPGWWQQRRVAIASGSRADRWRDCWLLTDNETCR